MSVSAAMLTSKFNQELGMSTNAGNNDKKIGVVHRAVGEQTNDSDSSISSQTKLNQEHQMNTKALTPAATSTAMVTRNTTQTKEELQMKTKQTWAHSTDPASKSVLKRFSTVMKILNLANQNRLVILYLRSTTLKMIIVVDQQQGLDYVLDLTGQIQSTSELVVDGFWRAHKGRWIEKTMNAVRPPIAVMVISLPPLMERQQNRQFKRELELWSSINHKNILPLLGIAYINADANMPAFISPWMENGLQSFYFVSRLCG
ncbi:hypothetical protein M378DRAFT_19497 [Amanita muscaria Koide BX008]|uniref:Protein kinase domain-containing protein n=1 Tax=Amanita muscaria (strain Koide BX008) TaxID=946122 RepID=A0A0C2WB54_AMAMK|nr:hypothetical protein M378DRAFT_19521 [Amanita muscaria Koide BX008]KIL53835.1 hypothetical protein M378DRAFT_19497 [Amanita muscaria Koide BX008]